MQNDNTQGRPSSDGTRERVTGPFKGYHVAVLGSFIGGEGHGYRGFYKICRAHPASYWTAESLAQGRCGPESSSGAGAMRMAENAAAVHIQGMAANRGDPPASISLSPNQRTFMSDNNPENNDPITGEPGAHPVGTGLGAGSGALAGAGIGLVAGPVGAAVGAVVGAVVGGLAGKEIAENANQTVGGAPSEHKLGEATGATGGALAGAAAGSIGGPVGSVIGAVIGAVAGGSAGRGAAEVVNPKPTDALAEHNLASGVGAGGGAMAGAAFGAMGGPVGAAVGAVVGAVAGSVAGQGVAQAFNPQAEDNFWRDNYHLAPHFIEGYTYDDYAPAYRTGYEAFGNHAGNDYESHEEQLQNDWNRLKGKSRLSWEQARAATRAGWHRVEQSAPMAGLDINGR